MQPNKIIDILKNKYYFTEYMTLHLYECTYKTILDNKVSFENFFGKIYYTYGYKILNIYDKNDKFIENKKLIHICTSVDNEYVDNLVIIKKNKIQLDDKIMFCL